MTPSIAARNESDNLNIRVEQERYISELRQVCRVLLETLSEAVRLF